MYIYVVLIPSVALLLSNVSAGPTTFLSCHSFLHTNSTVVVPINKSGTFQVSRKGDDANKEERSYYDDAKLSAVEFSGK